MALPVLTAPTHDLTLTSTGETIQFRPFLVKEEKILLMALESNDENEMMRAMKQIISSCILNDIDIEKLPIFDIQYLFIRMRSESVGEKVDLRFKHPEDKNSNNDECKHIQDIEINLKNIKPESLEGHTKKIDLSNDIGVVMKYPGLDLYDKFSQFETGETGISSVDSIFDIMIQNIEMIYQGDNAYYTEDHTKDEMTEFLNSLNTKQFDQLRNFFQTMPYLRHEFDYTCDKCGQTEHVSLNGIEDFFA